MTTPAAFGAIRLEQAHGFLKKGLVRGLIAAHGYVEIGVVVFGTMSLQVLTSS